MKKVTLAGTIIGLLLMTGVGCDRDTTKEAAALCKTDYCINLNSSAPFVPGKSSTLKFNITDVHGAIAKNFVVTHEKLLHLIVVRSDLQEFQHVHPEFDDAAGTFTLENFKLNQPGTYRLYADFTHRGKTRTAQALAQLEVTTSDIKNISLQKISATNKTQKVDSYSIELNFDPLIAGADRENTATFEITRDGKPVTNLQPYLGARGHLVMIRENSMEYIHTHQITSIKNPQTGAITFGTTLPGGGNYGLFLQFKHNDNIITSRFVIPIEGNSPEAAPRRHIQH